MEQLHQLPFDVPFRNQYVCAENYRAEGYHSLEEGLFWAERSCGIASVRMVIDAIRALHGLPVCPCQAEVLRRGLELEAYQKGVGWIHRGLVELAAEYGISGECRRGGTTKDVCDEIEHGNVCIVSVSPHFSGGLPREDGTPTPRGGHLIVPYGFYTEEGELTGLLTRHPDCFPEYIQPEYSVSIQRFDASFSGNYLVFDPKGCVCHEKD
ncbi:MAG: hypothetical protein LKJ86_01540 [Oscillibacter sp.]|nr:hypothetical protein [Oscillibacter sp.]